MDLSSAAIQYLQAGLSVIPCHGADHPTLSKKPALRSWKPYYSRRASDSTVRSWFEGEDAAGDAIAVVCGAVSGGLEILDFDDPTGEAYQAWRASVTETTPAGLVDALTIVRTPSGGHHVYYRTAAGEGNQKIARTESGATLIETRGEKGYALVPPSNGYHAIQTNPLGPPTISLGHRALLLDLARSLSRYVVHAENVPAYTTVDAPERIDGDPGTAYNASGWPDAARRLESHGWAMVRRYRSGKEEWRRPGKSEGISATYNGTPDLQGRFFVFSSNAAPFESERSYDAFGVLIRLDFNADAAAASRWLLDHGYGTPRIDTADAPRVTIGGRPALTSTAVAPVHAGDGAAGSPPDPEGGEAAEASEDANEERPTYPYAVDWMGRIVFEKGKKSEVVADFSARITAEITSETVAGQLPERTYRIEGKTVTGRTFRVDVGAVEFEDGRRLAATLGAAAGADAPVYSSMSGHIPPSIKKLTDPDAVARVRRFTRTGWADVDGETVYLAPGAAPDGVEVLLPGRAGYALPAGVDADRIQEAQAGLTALLQAMPPHVSTLVVSFLLLAPMARRVRQTSAAAGWENERFALMLVGPTGSLKTSFTQAAMCLYGEAFSRDETLLRWGEGATTNALMQHATTAHDAAIFIDNYKPNTGGGARSWVNLVHTMVEGGEKERLTKGAELRPARTVSAWPIFTGEDVPDADAAALARTIVVDVPPARTLENEALTEAQSAASALPTLLRAYTLWLASEDGAAVCELLANATTARRRSEAERLRAMAPQMANPLRVASNMALLALAWEGAMECPHLRTVLAPFAKAQQDALAAVARRMGRATASATEAERVLSALSEAIASGRALIVDRHTRILGTDGDRVVGFTDATQGGVFLLPDRVLEITRRLLGEGPHGSAPNITKHGLYAQLTRLGLVASTDTDQTCVRIVVGSATHGEARRVRALHLHAHALGLGDEAVDVGEAEEAAAF